MKVVSLFIGLLLLTGIAAAALPDDPIPGQWIVSENHKIHVSIYPDHTGLASYSPGWFIPAITDSFTWKDLGNGRFEATDDRYTIDATFNGTAIIPDGYAQYTLIKQS